MGHNKNRGIQFDGMIIWLVVLTILKNMSQWEGLSDYPILGTSGWWGLPTPLKNIKVRQLG
jgi:hypothetical protein